VSAINHFQTFAQRENHVTNNTMLMLRHVYRKSPWLFEDLLKALLEDESLEIGPRFEQQVGEAHSTPDAVLSQKPLHVYFEAKIGDGLYDEQLERHLKSIEKKRTPENSAFLIGLTLSTAADEDLYRWKKLAQKYGIKFASVTYRELIEMLSAVCANDAELQEVLDDYKTFVAGVGLMPDQYRKIAAMLCGQSWSENIEHGAYFEPATRNQKWRQASFLGIYRLKRISHVGRVVASAICRRENGNLVVEVDEWNTLTSSHKERVIDIMQDAEAYYQGFSAEPHRYYLVDRFVPTHIQKITPGGMMGHRYLDICELSGREQIDEDATSEYVAELLKGTTYD